MEKGKILIGCLGDIVALGVPGCIFVWMVMPVAISILKDTRTIGTALLLPNQSSESVEAAISDTLTPQAPYTPAGYVEGTCEELLQQGLRNFFVGEPNYTKSRDPDGDGLACEDR